MYGKDKKPPMSGGDKRHGIDRASIFAGTNDKKYQEQICWK
jgi:hypothetical protein